MEIKKLVAVKTFALSLLLGFSNANGSLIGEVEPNDGFGLASQTIADGVFSTGPVTDSRLLTAGVSNVENAGVAGWEWASIDSFCLPSAGVVCTESVDYYSFSVALGQEFIFDIDSDDGNIDSFLTLYDFNGNEITNNDDDDGDTGSTAGNFDSRIIWKSTLDGMATLLVDDSCRTVPNPDPNVGGFICSYDLASSAAYYLHISRTTTDAPIPEPSILALFGLGFLGLGFARRAGRS